LDLLAIAAFPAADARGFSSRHRPIIVHFNVRIGLRTSTSNPSVTFATLAHPAPLPIEQARRIVKNWLIASTKISRLTRLERGELVLETKLTYDGITPVRIRARSARVGSIFQTRAARLLQPASIPSGLTSPIGSRSASTRSTGAGRGRLASGFRPVGA
jgi:hypothetical protein